MPNCHVRIFTHPQNVHDQHSFLVANNQGGLSERLDYVLVDMDTTLRQVRRKIEGLPDRGMLRRTALYQELLFLMQSAPNPHGYGKEGFTYRFGVLQESSVTAGPDSVPLLVSMEAEYAGARVMELCPNLNTQDLVIIPASQISRAGVLSAVPSTEEELAIEQQQQQQQQQLLKQKQGHKQLPSGTAKTAVSAEGGG